MILDFNVVKSEVYLYNYIQLMKCREELMVFSGEVVRFGNRCKDPQFHNLDRYFGK